MTDEEYYRKMFAQNHTPNCYWHCDQYWWECTCGAVPVTELRAEKQRRALNGGYVVAPTHWMSLPEPPSDH